MSHFLDICLVEDFMLICCFLAWPKIRDGSFRDFASVMTAVSVASSSSSRGRGIMEVSRSTCCRFFFLFAERSNFDFV